MKRYFILLLTVLLFACGHQSTSNQGSSYNNTNVEWKFEDGYIPDSVSAIKVAEIVWLNVYGSEINDEKPFIAKLKEGKVWIVKGTFNGGKYDKGGVAYIEIQKSDGKILKVIHGK